MYSSNDTNYGQMQRPKRCLTAYNLYFQEERQRILDAIPDAPGTKGTKLTSRKPHGKIGFAELARVVAGKWKQLSEEERRPYVQRAAVDKERYRLEMVQWRHYKKQVENKKYLASQASPMSIRHLSTLSASTTQPSIAPVLEMGTSAGTNPQSLLPGFSNTMSGATLGHGALSRTEQYQSTIGPLNRGLLTPQLGSPGSTLPLSHQLVANMHAANQQHALPQSSQLRNEHSLDPTSRSLTSQKTAASIDDVFGEDRDTFQQSNGEQNNASEHPGLQEFLDGLDHETRDHFLRSMFNESTRGPSPS